MSPEATRSQAARHLGALRDLVAHLVPDEVPLPEALQLWDTFAGIERAASAAMALLARKVDESEEWQEAGYRSAAEFMAQRSGTSMAVAHAALATSKRLPDLPATESMLRAGELSVSQADTISRAAQAANKAAPDKNLGNAEADLLAMAPRASLRELRQESDRIRAAADPKPEATYERQRAERHVRSSTNGEGAWVLSGRGTADDGGAFLSTITAIVIELYAHHAGSDTPLSRDQLVYDALVEAMRRARCYANGIDITNDDHPYWDTITPDADTETETVSASESDAGAENETGSSSGTDAGTDNPETDADETSGPLRHMGQGLRRRKPPNPEYLAALHLELAALRRGVVLGGERCEIADVGAVPVPVARRLLDEAAIKLVVTDTNGYVVRVVSLGSGPRAAELIDPGEHRSPQPRRITPTYLALIQVDEAHVSELVGERAQQLLERNGQDVAELILFARHPNAAQRFALAWMQPQCCVEGCCRTALQYDHRKPYARTHWTWLRDLDRLCHHHHRLKTLKGWALVDGTGKRPMVPPADPRHPDNHKSKNPQSEERAVA